jgi:hypothetical protein
MISSLENLETLFSKMQSDGFNTNSPLKWGFYFVDSNKEKLEIVYDELKEKDYIKEGIFEINGEAKWTLHASKIDTLTPEKLHKRNLAFNDLADYCEIETYDGWDVEKLTTD